MKHYLLLLVLLPGIVTAQSKKKKKKEEEKANATIVAHLKSHISYLADDKLEGRRTGTAGETLAMEYIVKQYESMGIPPKGTEGYVQPFTIDEGKLTGKSYCKVNAHDLIINTEFYPLAFSAQKSVKGTPAMSLSEASQPWFFDLKETLEANKTNPHFDVEEEIKKEVERVTKKGATALFVYNSSTLTDNVLFNKNDKSAALNIPVIYITQDGYKKYFHDPAATLNIDLQVELPQQVRQSKNVVAFIDNHAVNTVILGAHYDHLGYGEDKNALDTGHVIHNGADDNASGTAALLELARMLRDMPAAKNNNYLLIHFSGEELGLLGSKYWIEHPSANITANYMINMDMVGRYDTAHKLTIGGYGTSPAWGKVLPSLSSQLITKYDSTGSGPSDHATFYRANIPVLFFFTGSHSDYHKASDDWDKINYDGEKDIIKFIAQVIERTDAYGKLDFTKTAEPQMGRSTRFTVSLGIMPDYGYSGTGVRVDGVSPGKLAERTGLQAGDILIQLGEYKFVDVMSYMQALSKFKKGDKTVLKIKRGAEEKEFNIEF